MTNAEVLAEVRRLLDAETTLTLATAGADGTPGAAPLFFYADEALALYWLSSPESRHSVNLLRDPRAAVSVYAATTDWRAIRGVQIEGTAAAVEPGPERDRIVTLYCARFGLGPELAGAIAASTLYVLRPLWLRYLDNARGFGWRCELDLA